MTIFGRNPVLVAGLIEAALTFLMTEQVLGLSQERIGLIMAVVSAVFAVINGFLTRDTQLSVITGLLNSVFALFAGYGITTLSPNAAAALIALVSAGFAVFNHTQTGALVKPTYKSDSSSLTQTQRDLAVASVAA